MSELAENNQFSEYPQTPQELKHLYKTFVFNQNIKFIQKKSKNIRIMVFNVHNWTDYVGKKSLDDIFNIIYNSDADIIGICEGLYFEKGIKQKIKEYSNIIGYNNIFEVSGKYGINLILSKYEIISKKILRLEKDLIKNENRYALKLSIKINLSIVNILLAHLDVWDETEETRLNQVKYIFENIDDTYLLIGDFNSLRKKDYNNDEWESMRLDSERRNVTIQHKVTDFIESNNFTDSFVKINKNCPKVTVWSMRRVDYIYLGNNFPFKLQNSEIFPTTVSDHFPVYIDIIIE